MFCHPFDHGTINSGNNRRRRDLFSNGRVALIVGVNIVRHESLFAQHSTEDIATRRTSSPWRALLIRHGTSHELADRFRSQI